MRCPHCGGEDCVRIHIDLEDEQELRFYSCRRCEKRWWEHGGEPITLDEALELTSKHEPPPRPRRTE